MYDFDTVKSYIYKFQPTGIIVDTEMLILLLVGSYSLSHVIKCKFTNKFSEKDFHKLIKLLSLFKKIIITPYIIAEVSNQSKQAFYGDEMYGYFSSVLNILKDTSEENAMFSSLVGMDTKIIADFGFTDMAMFDISKNSNNKIAIISNDTDFCIHAREKIPIIKFDDIKSTII